MIVFPNSRVDGMLWHMTMIEKLQQFFDEGVTKQRKLEVSAALATGRISKWKQGAGEIGASEALRMARALQVSVEWLIDEEKQWPPPERVSPDRQRQVNEIAERYGWDFVYWRLMDVIAGNPGTGNPPVDLDELRRKLAEIQPIGSGVRASNVATESEAKAAEARKDAASGSAPRARKSK